MFSNNLTLVEINDSTEFRNSNIFINKNDNEYYGYYMVLANDCTAYYKRAFLHVSKNKMNYIEVDRRTKVKDFFGTTNNIFKSYGIKITMNFDKININDDDLIPIDIHDVDIDNDRIFVVKRITDNSIWLYYNTGINTRNMRRFYVQKVGYSTHGFLCYDKDNLTTDYPSRTHMTFRVKDNVDVRFFIDRV